MCCARKGTEGSNPSASALDLGFAGVRWHWLRSLGLHGGRLGGSVVLGGWASVGGTTEQAPVAQRIEHLTTDQKVGGSNPSGRAQVRGIIRTSPGVS